MHTNISDMVKDDEGVRNEYAAVRPVNALTMIPLSQRFVCHTSQAQVSRGWELLMGTAEHSLKLKPAEFKGTNSQPLLNQAHVKP